MTGTRDWRVHEQQADAKEAEYTAVWVHGVVHHQRTSRRTRSLVLINLCAVDYSVLRGIKIAKFHTDWCDHHRDICPEPKKIKQLRQQDAYLANAGGGTVTTMCNRFALSYSMATSTSLIALLYLAYCRLLTNGILNGLTSCKICVLTSHETAIKVIECDELIACHLVLVKLTIWLTDWWRPVRES